VEIGLLGRFRRWAPTKACAIGAETQETIETEACDNPRPDVGQAYKPTHDDQSPEIGSELLRVSCGFDFVSTDHAGVLQRHMRHTTTGGETPRM